MHKIDRNAVPVPPCCSQPANRYSDLRGSDKEQIRTALLEIQRRRCAYCERRTGTERDDGHIEHFRNQANHRELDCDWENLFWSCNDEDTCGKHKDKCTKSSGSQKCFDRAHIIDPGRDDPEVLLLFVSDGAVQPKDGLSDSDRLRAEETIRVFQLNDSVNLRTSRKDAVDPYINALKAIVRIGPEYIPLYVEDTLQKIAESPFQTAIRSFLESVI